VTKCRRGAPDSAGLRPGAKSIAAVVEYLVEWQEAGDLRPPRQIGRDVVGILDQRGCASALDTGHSERWVDAAELARQIGRSRSYVYAHKKLLGGKSMSDGPRPRLSFDAAQARCNLAAVPGDAHDAPIAPGPSSRATRRPGPRPEVGVVPLLPVRAPSKP